MAKLLALYKQPEDQDAFHKHYVSVHAPLAKKMPGLKSFEVSDGSVLGPAGPSDIFFVAILTFDSMAALQQALGSPEGQATAADLANFASGGCDLVMCDTKPA